VSLVRLGSRASTQSSYHLGFRCENDATTIEAKAGHGAGKPVTNQIEEGTDVYSLFCQLG